VPELLIVATTAALDTRDLTRALERDAPPGVRITSAPGLLSPAAGGELTRDAARARGAVAVVVAPGGPDLANHALLTVEVARAAGTPVAAIVVAGPGGQDQRALLREHAGVEIVELPDPAAPSAAVASWPVADWVEAEPTAPGGGIALAPYAAWELESVPDPRSAGRHITDPTLLRIVEAEGPILATRAYRLYVRASGGKALTTIARAPLSGSTYRLRQQGKLEISTPDENPGQDDEVLRVAGSPDVRVRELGPRALDEVPLSEIAAVMAKLRATGTGEEDLARAVLDSYGLVRMTAKAEAYLALAREWPAA
jgi:hypothetical protein